MPNITCKNIGRKKKKTDSGKIKFILVVLLLMLLVAGCGASDTGITSSVETEQEQEPQGMVVEKESPEEDVAEDKSIYDQDEETSVVTMYLTVQQGNAADNTDHTWDEVNQYSTEYYDENDLERNKCEAILQIGDENGPLEGELGYGESVPNATVQIRGQTSSRRDQKSYKIRLKENMGEWRGQRTIALNKHVGDPVRFRNKLAYDLIKDIPQMIGARTQFVHLYVKDNTEGENGDFVDYGLFTQVEQMNKTYLKNHGLDGQGHLYKANFFEWHVYEDALKLKTDEDYDETLFEEYLEIKGDDDHTKLLEVIQKINDYSVPIEEIVEEYFDIQNICYWMAFHILTGNYDAGSRNYYIYSPLNSSKWYFISWDNDGAFSRTYYEMEDYSEGMSWQRGLSQFLHLELINRIFKEAQYREILDQAVNDLRVNYLTYEKIEERSDSYAETVRPYINRLPDSEYRACDEAAFAYIVESMPGEIEQNYQSYLESLEKPWPFFVGTPTRQNGQMSVSWDTAYDIDQEDITYDFWLAYDYDFQNVIFEQTGSRLPEAVFDELDPGVYYIRVQAENESGYRQDCFDYYRKDSGGNVYGTKAFIVHEDGTITEITGG